MKNASSIDKAIQLVMPLRDGPESLLYHFRIKLQQAGCLKQTAHTSRTVIKDSAPSDNKGIHFRQRFVQACTDKMGKPLSLFLTCMLSSSVMSNCTVSSLPLFSSAKAFSFSAELGFLQAAMTLYAVPL